MKKLSTLSLTKSETYGKRNKMITLTEIKDNKRRALDYDTIKEKTKYISTENVISLFLKEIGFESEIRVDSSRYIQVNKHKSIPYIEIIRDDEHRSLMLVNTNTKESYTITYSQISPDKGVYYPFFVKEIDKMTFEEGFN